MEDGGWKMGVGSLSSTDITDAPGSPGNPFRSKRGLRDSSVPSGDILAMPSRKQVQ